jgi:hypothetical protein
LRAAIRASHAGNPARPSTGARASAKPRALKVLNQARKKLWRQRGGDARALRSRAVDRKPAAERVGPVREAA